MLPGLSTVAFVLDTHDASHSSMDLSGQLSQPLFAFPDGIHQPVGSSMGCRLPILGGGGGIGAENQENIEN